MGGMRGCEAYEAKQRGENDAVFYFNLKKNIFFMTWGTLECLIRQGQETCRVRTQTFITVVMRLFPLIMVLHSSFVWRRWWLFVLVH